LVEHNVEETKYGETELIDAKDRSLFGDMVRIPLSQLRDSSRWALPVNHEGETMRVLDLMRLALEKEGAVRVCPPAPNAARHYDAVKYRNGIFR